MKIVIFFLFIVEFTRRTNAPEFGVFEGGRVQIIETDHLYKYIIRAHLLNSNTQNHFLTLFHYRKENNTLIKVMLTKNYCIKQVFLTLYFLL